MKVFSCTKSVNSVRSGCIFKGMDTNTQSFKEHKQGKIVQTKEQNQFPKTSSEETEVYELPTKR